MNLSGAKLGGEHTSLALSADGAVIGTALNLRRAEIRGEVSARTSRIGGRVLLEHGRIENPGGTALRLSRTEVVADVFCQRLTVMGKLRLTGAQIGRVLSLGDVRLANPGDVALDAEALQAGEVVLRPGVPVDGTVLLSHARLGVLRDDPLMWPERLRLDGLSYTALEPELPAKQRLNWLARGEGPYLRQPYEELAALYYTRSGQHADARLVLYAAERRQRAAKTVPGRVWGLLQDVTVGYGYRPASPG